MCDSIFFYYSFTVVTAEKKIDFSQVEGSEEVTTDTVQQNAGIVHACMFYI